MKSRNFFLFLLLIVFMGIAYHFSTHREVLAFLFPEKIWAHRVNSLPKLETASSKFPGVELDVVWLEDHLDVNHPPASSLSLSLEEYLASLKNEQLRLWLDFKNLDSSNAIHAVEYLEFHTKDFNQNRIIIETKAPEYLKLFKRRGYLTSYYLPSGFSSPDEQMLKQLKLKVDEVIEDHPVTYISTSLGEYVYLKEHFPEKEMLLWHVGRLSSLKNKYRIYKALLDEKVKVILLPFDSAGKR